MTPPMPTPVAEESSEKKIGKRAAADMIGAKLKRTNWGHGKPLERLTKAQIGLGPEDRRALGAQPDDAAHDVPQKNWQRVPVHLRTDSAADRRCRRCPLVACWSRMCQRRSLQSRSLGLVEFAIRSALRCAERCGRAFFAQPAPLSPAH